KRCPTPRVFATEARIHHLLRRAGPQPARFFFSSSQPPAMEKGPAGGSQRGPVEGGNAQEGRREGTHRQHRSLGDVGNRRGRPPGRGGRTPQRRKGGCRSVLERG